MDQLPDGLKTFIAASDLQTVIAVVVFTFVVQATINRQWARWETVVIWVPFLLSIVLTSVMSSTEEAAWGGKFYWRAVVQNGAVGLIAWRATLPQMQTRFPRYFPVPKNSHPKPPPPPVV